MTRPGEITDEKFSKVMTIFDNNINIDNHSA